MTNQRSYKCILLDVGKSDLRFQIAKDKFGQEREGLIEPDFYIKDCNVNEKSFKIQIWEFLKNQQFKGIGQYYFREAVVAILIYDITRRETFGNLVKWRDEVREKGPDGISFIVVGNNSDLENERRVEYEEGERFAKENEMVFFETSTKTGENVKEVFLKMLELINEKIESGILSENSDASRIKLQSKNHPGNSDNCAC